MADGSIIINTKINQQGFKQGVRQLEKGFNSLKNSLKNLAVAAGLAFGTAAIINFGESSVKAATELKSAMTGLQSILDGQGRSFAVAKDFIDSYTKDGLIPATDAIIAYKNLASRGYDTKQIEQTMLALKDSSAFGRQASLSMGEAVRTATEGLKNENSVLVDNAGVTKNVAKMWDEYAKSIGTTTNNLTQQQKIQAEVLGIMEETKFQIGDAAKVANSFSGQILQLQFSFNNLKIAIGNAIMPIAQAVLPQINAMVIGFTRLANVVAQFTTALFGKQVNTQKKQVNTQKKIADTAISAAKAQDKLAQSTTKAGKAAKNSLMSFDELNVLQSDLTDEDTPSPLIDGGTELSDIDPLKGEIGEDIKISPKIQELVDKFKSALIKIKGILMDFEPLLSGLGAAFMVAFGFKWIAQAIAKFIGLKSIAGIILAIKKSLTAFTMALQLTKNPLIAVGWGIKSLWMSFKEFMKGLSPMAKATVTLASMAAVFVTVSKAANTFTKSSKGLKDWRKLLLNTIPVIVAAEVALYAMLGPAGLVAGAIASIAGAVKGYSNAQKELSQQRVNEYFEGVALSAEDLSDVLSPMTSQFESLSEKISDYKNATAELDKEYSNTIASLDMLYAKLGDGATQIPEDVNGIYEGLLSLADTLRTITDTDTQYYLSAWDEVFRNTDALTTEREGEILANIIKLGEDKKLKIDEIERSITDVHTAAKERNVGEAVTYTAEELAVLKGFQEQLDQLMRTERNKQAAAQRIEAENFYNEIASGRTRVTKDNYEELLKTIEDNEKEAVRLAEEQYKELQSSAEAAWIDAQNVYEKGSEEYLQAQKDFNDSTIANEKNRGERIKSAFEQSGLARKILEEQLKKEAKAYEDTEEKINKYIEAIRKIVYFSEDSDEFKKLKKELETLDKALQDSPFAKWEKGQWKLEAGIKTELDNMISTIQKSSQDSKLTMETYGKNLSEGLEKGIEDKYRDLEKAGEQTIAEVIQGVKEKGKINSPSKELEKYGAWTAEGFKIGVENQGNSIVNAFASIFNRILDKTDEFAGYFRGAINGLMSGMAISLNGVSLNADNKIQYSEMPKLKIPKLARGGIIDSPIVAMVGEAGKEAVMPLENNTGWIDILAGKLVAIMSLQSQGGNQPIINISLDGKELSYEIDKIQSNESLRGNGR